MTEVLVQVLPLQRAQSIDKKIFLKLIRAVDNSAALSS